MAVKVEKPGTPDATAIGVDSITVSWSPLVSSEEKAKYKYEVLCCAVGQPEFTIHPSLGTMVTLCVRGLKHGNEYQFKVRAINEKTKVILESDLSSGFKTKEYYDIVLVGKTGIGKSTFGNNLLNLSGTPESAIRLFEYEDIHSLPPTHPRKKKRFSQANDPDIIARGDNILSVTDRCKLLANENSNIRVLDVPGFADSGSLERAAGTKVSVYEGNLQIIRWVVRAQIEFQLKVRRIVYFLPQRGALEKADGMLQEELKVLYHFFGKKVFDCMVIAATNQRKQKIQELGFDDEDMKETTRVIEKALEYAIPEESITCPPLVYVGLNDSPEVCSRKVQRACVNTEDILPLKFKVDTCSRCSANIRCSEENERIAIVHQDGTSIPYAQSKCHPAFVQKYNILQKVAGGVAHVFTFGIGLLVEKVSDKESWPGFTNSDEICVVCKQSPGALGCSKVGNEITYNENDGTVSVKVDHSNEF